MEASLDAVGQVLAHRARRQQRVSPWPSVGAAALLHALVLGALWIAPSLAARRPPLEFVPVQIIPAQALGVERPLGRPKREQPRAAEKPPAPAPEKPPEPEKPEAPAPPAPERERPKAPEPPEPAPPERDTRPAPPRERSEPAKPARPAKPAPDPGGSSRQPTAGGAEAAVGKTGPGGVAAVGKGEELGRRGSASGNPLGTSAFGSSIAGLEDPNFGYGYYIDRLLQLIDANWTRPPLGGEVRAVLYFRIQRNGSIDGLEVEESSGYNSFDLAALRAVQNASPFPALPASYRNPSLGIHLIVH